MKSFDSNEDIKGFWRKKLVIHSHLDVEERKGDESELEGTESNKELKSDTDVQGAVPADQLVPHNTCTKNNNGNGSYRNLFTILKSILFQHFQLPEGWWGKASGRYARTESVCEIASIQDRRYIATEGCPLERGVRCKAGSILDNSSKSKSKNLFKIPCIGRACLISVHKKTRLNDIACPHLITIGKSCNTSCPF